MFFTTRLRTFYIVTTITVLGILILGHVAQERAVADRMHQARKAAEIQLDTVVSTVVQNYLDEFTRAVQLLSKDPDLIGFLRQEADGVQRVHRAWETFLQFHPDAWYIYCADRNGRMIFRPHAVIPEGYDARRRPWFRRAVESPGEIRWTEPYIEQASGRKVISTVLSIQDPETGALLGVFGIDIAVDRFEAILSNVPLTTGSALIILSANNHVIGVSETGKQHPLFKDPAGLAALNHPEDFPDAYANDLLIAAARDLSQTNWRIIQTVPRSKINVERPTIRDLAFLLAAAVLLASGSSLVATTRSFQKRIHHLIRYISRVASGNLETRRLFSGRDEFGVLNDHFNAMLMARKDAEEKLKQAEQKYRTIVETAPMGIFQSTPQGELLTLNDRAADILGFSPSQMMDKNTKDLSQEIALDERDRGRFFQKLLSSDEVTDFNSRLRRKDGTIIWISINARANRDAKGRITLIDGFFLDVTEQLQSKAELERLATTDSLTGAWNRRYFMTSLHHEILRYCRYETPFGLLVMDIDHFKDVNDRHGHAAGDLALCELTRTCQSRLRSCDRFGRIGGEEFAVLLPGIDLEHAIMAAERIRKAVSGLSIYTDQTAIPITVSIGVAAISETIRESDLLLKEADRQLYAAKAAGRNQVSPLPPVSRD